MLPKINHDSWVSDQQPKVRSRPWFARDGRLRDARLLAAMLALCTLLIGSLVYVAHEASLEFGPARRLATHRSAQLAPLTVDASWILEGKPIFRTRSFSESVNARASAGVWECDGPAKFVWKYTTDETLYVLEGGSELEYLGVHYVLGPGSIASFPAGATVHWSVPNRIRKVFTLEEPGRVRRLLRKFFPAEAVPALTDG